MYDTSVQMSGYHDAEVNLPSVERTNMHDRRDANRDRLKDRARQGGVDLSGCEVAIGHAAWGGIWAGSGSVAGVISSAMASTCM